MLELNFLFVQFICFTANPEKEILNNCDLNPAPHPPKHCVLSISLAYATQKTIYSIPSPSQFLWFRFLL